MPAKSSPSFCDAFAHIPQNPIDWEPFSTALTVGLGTGRHQYEESGPEDRPSLMSFLEGYQWNFFEGFDDDLFGTGSVDVGGDKSTKEYKEAAKEIRDAWIERAKPIYEVVKALIVASSKERGFDFYDAWQVLVHKGPGGVYREGKPPSWDSHAVGTLFNDDGTPALDKLACKIYLPDDVGRDVLLSLFGDKALKDPANFNADPDVRSDFRLAVLVRPWALKFWNVTRKLYSESQFSRTASRRIKAKVELAKTTEKDFEALGESVATISNDSADWVKEQEIRCSFKALNDKLGEWYDIEVFINPEIEKSPPTEIIDLQKGVYNLARTHRIHLHTLARIHSNAGGEALRKFRAMLDQVYEREEWTPEGGEAGDSLMYEGAGDEVDERVGPEANEDEDGQETVAPPVGVEPYLKFDEKAILEHVLATKYEDGEYRIPGMRRWDTRPNSTRKASTAAESDAEEDEEESSDEEEEDEEEDSDEEEVEPTPRTAVPRWNPDNPAQTKKQSKGKGKSKGKAKGKGKGKAKAKGKGKGKGKKPQQKAESPLPVPLKPYWVQLVGAAPAIGAAYAEEDLESCPWGRNKEHAEGVIIADDMGLGKTFTSIMVILLLSYYALDNPLHPWVKLRDRSSLLRKSIPEIETEVHTSGMEQLGTFANTGQSKPPNLCSIIIAPTSLISNWISEFDRATDKLVLTAIASGRPGVAEGAVALIKSTMDRWNSEVPDSEAPCNQVLLISTSVLVKLHQRMQDDADDSLFNLDFGLLVFDECHAVKETSKINDATRRLSRRATFRIGLTGTPVVNKPIDMWRQLNALGFSVASGIEGKSSTLPLEVRNLQHIQHEADRLRRDDWRLTAQDWTTPSGEDHPQASTYQHNSQEEMEKRIEAMDRYSGAIHDHTSREIRKHNRFVIRRQRGQTNIKGELLLPLGKLSRFIIHFDMRDDECVSAQQLIREEEQRLMERYAHVPNFSPGLRVHGPAMVIGRQAVVAPHLFAHGAPWDLGPPSEIDLLEPTKMTALFDLIKLILEKDKDMPEQKRGKIVVHSDLVKILPLLLFHAAKRGLFFQTMTGNTKNDQRDRIVRQVNRDGDHPIDLNIYKKSTSGLKDLQDTRSRQLFCSFVGSLGINLARCNHVIMLTMPWSKAMYAQRVCRSHRPPYYPDQRPLDVTVYTLVVTNSADMALLEAGMTKAAFERTLVEAPVDVERGEDPMTALQRDDILPAFDAVREGATLELAQDRGLDLLKAFIDKQNKMERRSEIKKAMKPTEEEVLEQEREDAIKAVLNQAQREHYQHLGVIRIFAHFRPPYHAATLIDLVPRDTTVATMVETVAMSESQKQAEKEKEKKKKKKKKQRQQRDQIRFGAAAFQQALAEAVESWEDGADRPDPVLTMEGLNNILSSRERYLVEQARKTLILSNWCRELVRTIKELHRHHTEAYQSLPRGSAYPLSTDLSKELRRLEDHRIQLSGLGVAYDLDSFRLPQDQRHLIAWLRREWNSLRPHPEDLGEAETPLSDSQQSGGLLDPYRPDEDDATGNRDGVSSPRIESYHDEDMGGGASFDEVVPSQLETTTMHSTHPSQSHNPAGAPRRSASVTSSSSSHSHWSKNSQWSRSYGPGLTLRDLVEFDELQQDPYLNDLNPMRSALDDTLSEDDGATPAAEASQAWDPAEYDTEMYTAAIEEDYLDEQEELGRRQWEESRGDEMDVDEGPSLFYHDRSDGTAFVQVVRDGVVVQEAEGRAPVYEGQGEEQDDDDDDEREELDDGHKENLY